MFHISNSCCRVCMKESVILVDLFEPLAEDNCLVTLSEVLIECTGLEIAKGDDLPQKLCNDCAKITQMVHMFRKQALTAETEFRKLLSLQSTIKKEQIKTELKSEDDVDDIGADLLLQNYSVYENKDYEYDFQIPKPENNETEYNVIKELVIEPFIPKVERKKYTCDWCLKQYNKKQKLLNHLATHESNKLVCKICQNHFIDQQSLCDHMAIHSSNDNKCSICDEEFDTESLLIEHIVKHTGTINVKCPKCDIIFSNGRLLVTHLKQFHNAQSKKSKGGKKVKLFVCDVCQKEFSTKSLLNRHVKLHNSERPFQCSKCSKNYSRQDQLTAHMKCHDGIKPYTCSFCSKGFTQLCSLKDHQRTHTGETPYLCSECGKSFSNSSNLRQHMMRHTGAKPFACKLCPKTFATKGQMTAHVSTHTGAHPYNCDECGGSFTKLNSLKKHKLIHLGVKPFGCDTCNMRFSCKEHLKRHYRIHTGEKPYKCTQCERAFTQSNDLVKHMRMHVGQNIYQCTVCKMRFRLISELKHHYPIHYVNGDEVPKIPISKGMEAPVLILKPQEINQPAPETTTNMKDLDPTITITINSNGLDKNGLAGDITINLSSDKS